jgi:hypothetical protein
MKFHFLVMVFVLASSMLIGQDLTTTSKIQSNDTTRQSSLENDLLLMKKWFGGEFNNYQQVHKEREDSISKELQHEHIHSIFKEVELPLLGHHVYFVKQYMDNDPKKIYRQRIYNFFINHAEKAIQLDIYSFMDTKTDSIFNNADKDPKILTSLKMEQIKLTPGCEVFWKKQENHFIGYMKERACNFISKRSGKRIYITDSLMLNENEIWIRDEAEDEDGKYVFGHRGKIPHKLKKIQHYTGWAAAIPTGNQEMKAIRGLNFHNQGDRKSILFDDGSPTGYDVRLAQLVYGKDLEILQIAIFKTGEEKVLEYIWSDAASERIGINIKGAFQIGLTKSKN